MIDFRIKNNIRYQKRKQKSQPCYFKNLVLEIQKDFADVLAKQILSS